MDSWDTDYTEANFENVTTLCGGKIDDSSHYLGVFAEVMMHKYFQSAGNILQQV